MPSALRFVPGILEVVKQVVAKEMLAVLQKVDFVAAKVRGAPVARRGGGGGGAPAFGKTLRNTS